MAVKKSSSSSRDQKNSEGSSKNQRNNRLPPRLTAAEVYREASLQEFKFKTTKEIPSTDDFIAQDRAVRAINLGLGIRKPGYNIYVSGYEGTGRTSVIRSFLGKWSAKAPTPKDWIYVYDFDRPEQPKAIELPRGEARKFKKKIVNLVRDLRSDIPKALQSEDYENSISTYISASNDRKSKLFGELEKLARSHDFVVKTTRVGIETIPFLNGRPLTEKEYSKLDDETRERIEQSRAKLEPEVLDFARKVRNIDAETKSYIDTLRYDFGLSVVGTLVNPLIEEYNELACVDLVKHLEVMREQIVENLLDFAEEDREPPNSNNNNNSNNPPARREDGEYSEEEYIPHEERDPTRRYQVNVFIDNSKTKGAPVVIETNPTFFNLFGRIEKNVDHGVYQSDFTMIKCGSIHRANGGYLVLNANDIFRTPGMWETLKRVLRNREAFIEDVVEQVAFVPPSGLRPQPVPLDLKVILIGNDEIYQTLFEEDVDFSKIFKVKADFDHKMQRKSLHADAYVNFVASRVVKENLLAFDKSAVAAIVEFGSRLVEDQRLLSTQFGVIKDLIIEADYAARQVKSTVVKREHIEKAIDDKHSRLNLIEESLLEMIEHEDILIRLDGATIGQINALTVYEMGDHAFGKVCRLSCTTSIGKKGIINVERASGLSGRSHDKGVFIIGGFISALLAKEKPLGINAHICFEQSYGMIDGDSASAAELIAILSSLANIPIYQNFAVTGSVNQRGEIQAIGGVNDKIEGFYKHCKLTGKSKRFGVLIPQQNVSNLMLHRSVRDGINNEHLDIFPVRYIWEAFELLTGVPLGIESLDDPIFMPGSALEKIAKRFGIGTSV